MGIHPMANHPHRADNTGMKDNLHTSTYPYNGDGLRMSRTAGGATTDYVWDVGSALPLVLQD